MTDLDLETIYAAGCCSSATLRQLIDEYQALRDARIASLDDSLARLERSAARERRGADREGRRSRAS
jgi:hypothetical protein